MLSPAPVEHEIVLDRAALAAWAREAAQALGRDVAFDRVVLVIGRGRAVAVFFRDYLTELWLNPYCDYLAGDMHFVPEDTEAYKRACFRHWGYDPPEGVPQQEWLCPCAQDMAAADPLAYLEGLGEENWSDVPWPAHDAIPVVY